jgi:hypothetical protein
VTAGPLSVRLPFSVRGRLTMLTSLQVKKDRGTGKPPVGSSDPKAAKAAPTGPVDAASEELVVATESIKLATE